MDVKLSVKQLVKDTLFHVQIPQQLVIRSPRLGILLRVLQVITVIGILSYLLSANVGTEEVTPVLEQLSVWPEEPVDVSRATDVNVRHCQSSWEYYFTYGSGNDPKDIYEPDGCRNVTHTEGYIKKGRQLMIATYVYELDVFRAPASACLQSCTDDALRKDLPDGGCECRRLKRFFVHNAEETMVAFLHSVRAGDRESQEARPLVSIFLRSSGERCQVGGVDEVRAEPQQGQHAVGTVRGSIREWLACAGLTMDSSPAEVGLPNDTSVTYLRTMGFRLVFELSYSNAEPGYDSVDVCYVTPTVEAAWTSAYQHGRSQTDMHQQTSAFEYARVVNGVSVQFKPSGSILSFSFKGLVNGIVNVLFLLTLPQVIVQILVLWCLGSLSTLYDKARSTYFDVHEQIRVALANSLLPLMTFRALIGGDFTKRAERLPTLPWVELKRHLQDVFKEQLDAGKLEDRHINRMVMILCEEGGELEGLDYKTFERICMTNNIVSSESLIDMLHYRRKRGLLEKLMDEPVGSPEEDVLMGKMMSGQVDEERRREQRMRLEEDQRNQLYRKHHEDMERHHEALTAVEERISSVLESVHDAQEDSRLAIIRSEAATKTSEDTVVAVRELVHGNEAEHHYHGSASKSGADQFLRDMEMKLELSERLCRAATTEAADANMRVEAMAAELKRLRELEANRAATPTPKR